MLNIAISLLSVLIVFSVSSNYSVDGLGWQQKMVFLTKIFLIAGSIALSSIINGHDLKMFLKSRIDYFVNLIVSVVIGLLISVSGIYLLGWSVYGRWTFLIIASLYTFLVFSVQLLKRWRCKKIYLCGYGVDRFKVVMSEIGGSDFYNVYEVYNSALSKAQLENLDSKIRNAFSGYIVPSRDDVLVIRDYIAAKDQTLGGYVLPLNRVIENELGVVDLESVIGFEWWDLVSNRDRCHYIKTKRILDLIFALGIFIVTLPILILVAIILKIEGSGSIIYKQTRVGLWGSLFTIYKFRTMKMDSEKNGPQWAQSDDNRVTLFGKILRKTRIDELPQLWNIANGDMSLVGPRPERPELCALIDNDVSAFKLRLASKPGLSGWAQVNYRYGASVADSKIKLAYDLYYVKNASILLDFRILTRTVLSMVRGAR